MTKALSSLRTRVVAVALCLALAAGMAWFAHKYFAVQLSELVARLWPPATTEQIETRRLHKISGWFSRDCGHVPRHGDADAAIACANDALRSGKRFYVSFDYVGIDSHGTSGLAMGADRKVYEVVTDDLRGGAVGALNIRDGNVNVDVIGCESAPVERTGFRANRFLTCRPE